MASFPASRLARNLLPPITFSVAAVACLAGYDAEAAVQDWPRLSQSADSLGPLGLTSSALSLLLVFRTNSSYNRFVESRQIWGAIVNTSRDLVRRSLHYFPREATGEKAACARWVIALAHSVRLHMRTPHSDAASVLAAARPPLQPAELTALLASAHRPNYALHALTALVSGCVADRFTAQSLDGCLSRMEDCVGGLERLYRTPIPLSYTRHTSRLLLVWLLYSPIALWGEYGGGALLVAPLLTIALFGVEEIGVELEEPGGILPMEAICASLEDQVMELLFIDATVKELVADSSDEQAAALLCSPWRKPKFRQHTDGDEG